MGKSVRVLLIEDGPSQLGRIEQALREGGYEPNIRRVDTPQALDAALERQGWDIVLVDYELSSLSGAEAMRIAARKQPNAPLILLAGSITEAEAAAALHGGARDVIAKDNLARLAPAVERELEQARILEERRKAEKRIRFQSEILSQMHEAVLVSDRDGAVTYWNHMAEGLYGLKASQAFGQPLESIAPYLMEPAQREACQKALETQGFWRGECEQSTPSGRKLYVDASLSLLADEQGRPSATLHIVRDISERHRTEQALRSLGFWYGLIRDVNSLLLSARSEQELLEKSCQVLRRLERADSVWIEPVDSRNSSLRSAAAESRPRVETQRPDAEGAFTLSLPLRIGKDHYGTLHIRFAAAEALEAQARTYLEEIASNLSLGLHSLRLEKRLASDLLKSRRMLSHTIEVITSIIESKDPYTTGHQNRVAELSYLIAREMGLPGEQAEQIRITGLVHDIGKVGIPSELLAKPGKITEAELAVIKTHSDIGHDIMKKAEFGFPLAEIIRQHHERLDGSGYPRGLKGQQMLLQARIIAVADVVEAMAMHRPYRPALGIEQALVEIERHKGGLYDPRCVEACVRLFREQGYHFE